MIDSVTFGISRVVVVVLGVMLATCPASAIDGKPRVIDGDTIEIAGERIRLHGIDAPEDEQTCTRGGEEWYCGKEATFALAAMIEGNWVECDERGRDRYGRIIGVCRVGGSDGINLNERMVAAGWAIAYPRYSHDYVAAENEAREGQRGIWIGEFVEPETWRRNN